MKDPFIDGVLFFFVKNTLTKPDKRKAQAPLVIDEENWSEKTPRPVAYPALGRPVHRDNS